MPNLDTLMKERDRLKRQLASAIAENKRALKINKELREENIRLKILIHKTKALNKDKM